MITWGRKISKASLPCDPPAEEALHIAGQAGFGGERGIRTPGALAGTTVFKTAAIDHSAISPWRKSKNLS
jgi:hypothetical protein